MKNFTNVEWEKITRDDPILSFLKRVDAAALAKPYWSEDFRRATCHALGEEHTRYIVEKYGEGKPFSISAPCPNPVPSPPCT